MGHCRSSTASKRTSQSQFVRIVRQQSRIDASAAGLILHSTNRCRDCTTRMSTINKFLSRKDKHSHGTHKDKVMSSPARTPSPIQTPSSTRSRKSSYSSSSSLSLAFSTLITKRSPRLQAHDGMVECCTADNAGFLLQPKRHSGTLNGFFEGLELKTPEKDEEKKV